MKNDIDIETQRNKVLETYEMSQLWEVSIGCDNLYCNVAGKSPNPLVIVQIKDLVTQRWINYGKSEMLEVRTYLIIHYSPRRVFHVIYKNHLFFRDVQMPNFSRLSFFASPMGSMKIPLYE